MLFEHHTQPVLPYAVWLLRLSKSIQMGAAVVIAALLIGMLGYHFIGNFAWIDSYLESSMILAGMGPVAPMQNNAIKFFAGCYALFSGFVMLTSFSIMMAPVLHRFLHYFHKKQINNEGDYK